MSWQDSDQWQLQLRVIHIPWERDRDQENGYETQLFHSQFLPNSYPSLVQCECTYHFRRKTHVTVDLAVFFLRIGIASVNYLEIYVSGTYFDYVLKLLFNCNWRQPFAGPYKCHYPNQLFHICYCCVVWISYLHHTHSWLVENHTRISSKSNWHVGLGWVARSLHRREQVLFSLGLKHGSER